MIVGGTMMKSQCFICGCIVLCSIPLNAYQVQESGGLLGALSSAKSVCMSKERLITIEKRADGSLSNVISINGKQAFVTGLIKASILKPVVIFVYSAASTDSEKMKPIFHQVADLFNGKVIFASIDLLAKKNDVLENQQILAQIMHNENIKRLDLPLFLFIKDAALYTPAHLAPAILQGVYTKENLAQFVQNKYFPSLETIKKHVIPSSDFIMTTTDSGISNVDFRQGPVQWLQKKEPHQTPTLKERFLRFFKMKK